MKRLYLLDLDRTLFDSERFLTDILALLQAQTNLKPTAFRAAVPNWREGELYFFYEQVKAMTGINQAGLEQLINERLGHDYLFADVIPWLKSRHTDETAAVVTVGLEAFQQLKLQHTHGLEALSQTIVQINKGTLLAEGLEAVGKRHYRTTLAPGQYEAITLVDDNPASFLALGSLPPVTTYHLARPGQTYAALPTPAGTIRITTLRDLILD